MFSTKHEALAVTVSRASDWATENGVRVINVETVVLPNIGDVEEASKPGLYTSGDMSSQWYQVVRVWYESPNAPA